MGAAGGDTAGRQRRPLAEDLCGAGCTAGENGAQIEGSPCEPVTLDIGG